MISVSVIHVFSLELNDGSSILFSFSCMEHSIPNFLCLVCDAGDGTLGLRHAQQILYYEIIPPVPYFCFDATVL